MRRFVRAIPAILAVGLVVVLFVLGQTWVLTVVGGGLLLVFGALWPGLWVASLVRPGVDDGGSRAAARNDDLATPLISVLIPARNEESVIGGLVSQILGQDYPHWQLLVVANNCTDQTAAEARAAAGSDARVTVIETEFDDGMKADALNLGLEHANGEIVLEIDADNRVMPSLLGQVARIFDDSTVDACQTQIRAGNASANLLAALQDLEFLVYSEIWNRGRRAVGVSSSIGGTGFAIRTALIKGLGGWHRELVEDFDLHMRLTRAGAKVAYLHAAVVFDEKPVSWAALVKQRRRWMCGHMQLAFRGREERGKVGIIDTAYLFSPVLVGLSITLFAIGLTRLFWPQLLPTYGYLSPWFWFASLMMTVLAFSSVVVRSKSMRLLPLVIPYVFVFTFHWIVIFAFSRFRPSWGMSKTDHGVKDSRGLAWSLGGQGWASGALGTLVLLVAIAWLTPLVTGLIGAPSPLKTPILVSGRSVVVAEASPVDGVAQGVVHDFDAVPVAGAKVKLSGPVSVTTQTNSKGKFAISPCPAGSYKMTVGSSGHEATTEFKIESAGGVGIEATLSNRGAGLVAVPLLY